VIVLGTDPATDLMSDFAMALVMASVRFTCDGSDIGIGSDVGMCDISCDGSLRVHATHHK